MFNASKYLYALRKVYHADDVVFMYYNKDLSSVHRQPYTTRNFRTLSVR